MIQILLAIPISTKDLCGRIEHDVAQGVTLDTFSVKAEKKRQTERMAEIEKVKKRREDRAIEKAQHEEEMALIARERAQAESLDWEKKEEDVWCYNLIKAQSDQRLDYVKAVRSLLMFCPSTLMAQIIWILN